MEHKGWNSRGYLPHCDYAGSVQGITFRLADSVPMEVLAAWKRATTDESPSGRAAQSELFRRIAKYEDSGHGECLLKSPDCADIVQQRLIAGHGEAYRLIEWCVMPNHVHVLIGLDAEVPLGRIVQGWKGGSALGINRTLGRRGTVWMEDYHDRFIRDQVHLIDARIYIRMNPVKAGFCKKPEDWVFSSAGQGWKH